MAIDRRGFLCTSVAAAIATTDAVAQPMQIHGEIRFQDGGAVPKGRLEVYLEDPADGQNHVAAGSTVRIESDGRANAIPFSLTSPASETPLQIVVRLERPDGWLIARGSAGQASDGPRQITLYTAMY